MAVGLWGVAGLLPLGSLCLPFLQLHLLPRFLLPLFLLPLFLLPRFLLALFLLPLLLLPGFLLPLLPLLLLLVLLQDGSGPCVGHEGPEVAREEARGAPRQGQNLLAHWAKHLQGSTQARDGCKAIFSA